jgi:hypothetical protein
MAMLRPGFRQINHLDVHTLQDKLPLRRNMDSGLPKLRRMQSSGFLAAAFVGTKKHLP